MMYDDRTTTAAGRSAVLPALFTILVQDGGNRVHERRAITQGCRDAGFTTADIAAAWKAFRQTPAAADRLAPAGGAALLSFDDTVVLFSCLVFEADRAVQLTPLVARMVAPAVSTSTGTAAATRSAGPPATTQGQSAATPAEPAVVALFADAAPIARLPFVERLVTIEQLLLANGFSAVRDQSAVYVANQVTAEGFDELQRLCLAAELGLHVALDGPPGVGKTQSVIEVCRILGKPLFTKNCSSRSTEAHIIAGPILRSDNGVTVTDYQNGPLARALRSGGIFYADEFNLLKEDVQKRLNSAFDDRRSIDRPDGRLITAEPGFWSVISYNPTEGIASRDLEESVADRFVHIHYKRWSADFKAWVAYSKARGIDRNKLTTKNQFGLPLVWRGINAEPLRFFAADVTPGGLAWRDFLTGETVTDAPSYRYLVCDQSSMFFEQQRSGDKPQAFQKALASAADQAFDELELSRMLAQFSELLYDLVTTGNSPALKTIGLGSLRENEDLDVLRVHVGSSRIDMAAARHYRRLCDAGCNRYLAQAFATRVVIDQACYGQFRDRKLRNMSTYELVTAVAKSMRLLMSSLQMNTKFDPADLLRPPNKRA